MIGFGLYYRINQIELSSYIIYYSSLPPWLTNKLIDWLNFFSMRFLLVSRKISFWIPIYCSYFRLRFLELYFLTIEKVHGRFLYKVATKVFCYFKHILLFSSIDRGFGWKKYSGVGPLDWEWQWMSEKYRFKRISRSILEFLELKNLLTKKFVGIWKNIFTLILKRESKNLWIFIDEICQMELQQ